MMSWMARLAGAVGAGALVAIGASGAHAQTAPDSVAYVQAEETHAEGQGVFVRSSRGCLLVTAAHVVAKADFVIWRNGKASGRAKVAHAFHQNDLDIAFAEPLGDPPAVCPDVPGPAATAPTPTASIVPLSATGHPSNVLLAQTEFPPNLAFSPSVPGQSIQTGFSGSGVWSGGVLIGIATEINSAATPPKLKVQRFDDVPPAVAEWLRPATGAAWPPFDLRQLPEDFRKVAVSARANKDLADAAIRSALQVAREADEAAVEARRPDSAKNGFAVFATPEGEYAGAFVGLGKEWRAKGPGVLTFTKGKLKGRQVECVFDGLETCAGQGREKFENTTYADFWVGQLCGTSHCNFGMFRNKDSYEWYGNASVATGAMTFGVRQAGNPSTRGEAMTVNGGFEGPVLTWDFKSGKALSLWIWKQNKPVEDHTKELRAAP